MYLQNFVGNDKKSVREKVNAFIEKNPGIKIFNLSHQIGYASTIGGKKTFRTVLRYEKNKQRQV